MTKGILTLGVVAVILLVFLGVEVLTDRFRPRTGLFWRCLIALSLALLITALFTHFARARDLDGRYAASPLKTWFDGLRSGKGPCCSDADGSAVSDVDWETRDGRYRVRLEGKWIDVPDDAVITEPNRAGRTMVWPMYSDGVLSIRCFIPGSMT